jgi:hypothetical protein
LVLTGSGGGFHPLGGANEVICFPLGCLLIALEADCCEVVL